MWRTQILKLSLSFLFCFFKKKFVVVFVKNQIPDAFLLTFTKKPRKKTIIRLKSTLKLKKQGCVWWDGGIGGGGLKRRIEAVESWLNVCEFLKGESLLCIEFKPVFFL